MSLPSCFGMKGGFRHDIDPAFRPHCRDSDIAHCNQNWANAMIAVIFESWPAPGKMQTYLDMGARLGPQLEKIDGFISIERFQSFSDPGKLLALSIWRDEASVDAFRNWNVHRNVQSNSRKDVFLNYRLRVAVVLRDYGMTEREQAPEDSRAAHV